MDPPATRSDAERPLPPHRQRRGGVHVQWTLLFTVSFVILSLFKLEPIARNSLRDHNAEIDTPHNNNNNEIDSPGGGGAKAQEERSLISTNTNNNFPKIAIQRTAGDGWNMINFSDNNFEMIEDICDIVTFTSTTGNSAEMCVHKERDFVSNAIRRKKRWGDCDPLPRRWNASQQTTSTTATGANKKNEVYVEIGANIGSCVMEMLLSTDSNIVAFEPTLRNYQLLSKTISLMGPEYQQRVALFPIGLGSESAKSQVYSAKGNMGNSVVGKPIKDFPKQQFDTAVDVFIERIDSILSYNISIPLMKLDAQGFECNILDGMSPEIATNIQQVKFELAQKWLRQQGCTDFLPHLRKFGFNITNSKGGAITSDSVNCGVCDAYATRE